MSPNTISQTTTPVLEDRTQYETCHIDIPDEAKPLAGIFWQGRCYSFVRCLPTLEKINESAARLVDRGNQVVLTKNPRGYSLWVEESDGQRCARPLINAVPVNPTKPEPQEGFCKFLRRRWDFKTCQIRVPDLDKPLTAITLNSEYYSLVKTMEEEEAAMTLGQRLSARGDRVMITPGNYGAGFSLWIYEPEATPSRRH
jgi:hypothetical protein